MNTRLKLLALTLAVGVCLSWSAAWSPVTAQSSGLLLRDGDLTAICGDSITEQKIYSMFIEEYLLACQPAAKLQTVQFGWGGETAPGFLRRMDRNVTDYHPTVATTFYGMNDGGYRAYDENAQGKAYREGTLGIVKKFKELGVRVIVVGSPGVVDSDAFNKRPNTPAAVYNETLKVLGDIAREIADSEGVTFADVHTLMMDVMTRAKAKYGAEYHVGGPDGVHPAANGHLVIAYAFLKALGCDGNIGAITYDFGAGRATADRAQNIIAATDGEIQVESTRYPFCFIGPDVHKPGHPFNVRSILEFLPFNEDLNRYTLTVKNARGDLKVTWGKESKVFPADTLAKGVNLAAEFLDNPFTEAFAKLDYIVRQQQYFETPIMRLIASNATTISALPDEAGPLGEVNKSLLDYNARLRKLAGAAVQPVTHTIKIESAN
ncbi:MAG: SGNH/GDSL hydrolase family protein [Verrucomicrobiales bacterium]|jgi:lysophospholipase L1-like esterase|nr:SGNH/GDSL hydrolase family protein [Verrucomicrobiales bacterium]